ncbi:hypothetical protein [Sphingobium sp.]|uniref:hypothetical protein n=1 Tax=Sphingobium sp. TaxID=1912891 RepID=UPI000DB4DB4D|nr:hypothetical protein [Sphingobium sp.]PZU68699.1 MAG: hypothetical protein DI540_08085 [Sphingobium sp.]
MIRSPVTEEEPCETLADSLTAFFSFQPDCARGMFAAFALAWAGITCGKVIRDKGCCLRSTESSSLHQPCFGVASMKIAYLG